uniref:Putative tail protein n=1 Tax=viral metagenome TaxID=1070528 RepID=A0A6M3IR43_9ZZZZ
MVAAASITNNIEGPPRLTGDSGRDTVAIIQWLSSFYTKAILSGGLLQPQNMDPSLISLGDLVAVADQFPYYTAEDTFDLTGLTAFARSILDDDDAATVRATIGAGTLTAVTATAPVASSGGNTPVISIADFVASGATHARGAVPDPGAAAGTTKFLREDATFAVPPGVDEVTAQAVGFTITKGTTPKTLTVALDASVSGTNTGDQTNITGNAATVTTNANLTGPITSAGNATAVAAQTGTGSTFVMDTSPTLIEPVIGVATGTSLVVTGPVTTMKQSGATTKASSVGEVYPFTPGASKTVGIQCGNINGGGIAVLSNSADGGGAVFYFEYKSATTVKLTGDAVFVAGLAPAAGEIGVGKSANSATLQIVTGSGISGGLSVCVLGQNVTGTTEPA